MIYDYFELATDLSFEHLAEIKEKLEKEDNNPMVLKKELGETLVDMYHSKGSGKAAREEFERIFSQKKLPDNIPEINSEQLKKLEIDPERIYLVHLITKNKLAKSNSESK